MSETAAVAIAGILLGSFGSPGEVLKTANPWHGFQADGPNVVSFRVQHVDGAHCAPWVSSFLADPRGVRLGGPPGWKDAWKTWEPWNDDDLDAVKDCKSFPCDVKVNEKEASEMKSTPKEARLQRWEALVAARAERYLKTDERKEYEFPGDPVDPWEYLSKLGLHSSAARPAKADLWIRKYNLDPKKMKTLHQVLDRRTARNASGTEAALWVRDAYTDHYFDGWGEWASVICDPQGAQNRGVTLVQSVFLEVDLLKKTDLFSKIGRGKLKGALEEKGARYLDVAFERIRDGAISTP